MKWYTAHALLYFKYTEGEQGEYLVWEHLYLIRAATSEEANARGITRAKQDESREGDGLTVNGRPAALRFAGMRKVVECQDLDLETGLPTDGTELSYSELTAVNGKEFGNLVHGEAALVIYQGIPDPFQA